MNKIRVFIMDDQEIVRNGLRRLLEMEPDIELVGEAANANNMQLVAAAAPDVILMDVKMPGTDGIAATRTIKQILPKAKVLILTAYNDTYLATAIQAGADGYIVKDISGAELVQTVRAVAQGDSPIHLTLTPADLPDLVAHFKPASDAELSSREVEILRLVAQGKSNGAIAEKLFLSERTVKRILTKTFGKLRVHTRAEAIAYALEHHLI